MSNRNLELDTNAYKFAGEIDDIIQTNYGFELSREDYLGLIEIFVFPSTIEKQLKLRSDLSDLTPRNLIHRLRYIEKLIKLFATIQKRSRE
jgi:hypothetical protein